MDPVQFSDSPLEQYLREADIDEHTYPIPQPSSSSTSSIIDEDLPAVVLPGSFLEEVNSRSADAEEEPSSPVSSRQVHRMTSWLPSELLSLLSLSTSPPSPPQSPPVIGQQALLERSRYVLISSSLLDASLPKATLRPSPAYGANSHEPNDVDGEGEELVLDADGEKRSQANLAGFHFGLPFTLLLSSGQLVLLLWAAVVFCAMWWFSSNKWTTTVLLALLTLVHRFVVVRPRSSSDDSQQIEHPDAQESALPSQSEAVLAIVRLVDEAEAFDRTCNSVLARVWETDKRSSNTDLALPLLPIRTALSAALASLALELDQTHLSLQPLTSPSDLSALSTLYALDLPLPDNPSSVDRAMGAYGSPLRPLQTSSGPLSPLRSERFASPPAPVRPQSALGHTHPDAGGMASSPLEKRFTRMPPRTPRTTGQHHLARSSFASLRGTPSTVGARSTSGGGMDSPALLPSPTLTAGSVDERRSGMMVRSPSLDETHELLPTSSSPSSSPSSSSTTAADDPVEYVLPDQPVQRSAAAPCTPLKLDLSSLAGDRTSTPTSTSKSAKRRSLQDIPYRHHPHAHQLPLSPLGRSSEDSPSFTFRPGPSAGSPSSPVATDDVPHRPKRFSFSPSAVYVRPTALELGRIGTRHRSTLSTPVFHSPPPSSSSQPPMTSPSSTPSLGNAGQRSPALEPMSHADLLGSFVALHSKRRAVLVHLLALRKTSSVREEGDDIWSAVGELVQALAGSFESVRRDVRLALLGAPSPASLLHADDEDGSFAPPSQTRSELEREALSDLRTVLASLSTSLNEAERARESGTFDAAWLGLREDVGEVVRSWERGRATLGLQSMGGLERGEVERVLPAQLNVAGWEPTSSPSHDLPDSPSADPSNEEEEKEDDVALFQRSSTLLPVAGREVLFSATSTPHVVLRPPSGFSRAERIRLARELRADVQAGKKEGKKEKRGPEGMGEVIGELNGLMGVLRRLKASPSEEEEDNVEPSSERPSSANQQPLAAPQGGLRVGGRSSLPALSQGSSDGSQESDESDTQLELGVLRRAGGSQGTLKATSSTKEGDSVWRTVDEEGPSGEGLVFVQDETLLP